jgi:hypothetical protein
MNLRTILFWLLVLAAIVCAVLLAYDVIIGFQGAVVPS